MLPRMRIGIALGTGLLVVALGCKGNISGLGPMVGQDGGGEVDASNDGLDGGGLDGGDPVDGAPGGVDARIVDAQPRADARPVADAAPAPFCTPRAGTNLKLTRIADGFENPVFVTAPTRDPRIFVVEQPGRIRVIKNGVLQTVPFLDMDEIGLPAADRVNSVGDERGLLGLAFHPGFATNGRFFIHYTANRTSGQESIIIAEYHADPGSDVAQTTPGRVLVRKIHTRDNHNGGTVEFGPDGYLYFSIGDNSADDAPQSTTGQFALFGKLNRIDVDEGSPYAIPADNPFARQTEGREIYALGLRNPYRFSIDHTTGHIFIGDVGEGQWEEIDVIPSGDRPVNFGWPMCEGAKARGGGPTSPNCSASGVVAPVVAYNQNPGSNPDGDGCVVIGGLVYRGTCMSQMVGQYFFADRCMGRIKTFAYQEGQTPSPVDHAADFDRTLLEGQLSSFGVDGFGEMYVTALGAGILYRVEVD